MSLLKKPMSALGSIDWSHAKDQLESLLKAEKAGLITTNAADAIIKRMMEVAISGGDQTLAVNAPAHTHVLGQQHIPPHAHTAQNPGYTLQEKLSMRMGWPKFGPTPYRYCMPVENGEEVVLFLITAEGAEPVILKDQAGLFPSDTLITKLRML